MTPHPMHEPSDDGEGHHKARREANPQRQPMRWIQCDRFFEQELQEFEPSRSEHNWDGQEEAELEGYGAG